MELTKQVEHRFVIQTPGRAKSVEQWAKETGATFQKIADQHINSRNGIARASAETIEETLVQKHQTYVEVNGTEEDEIETQKRLKTNN